MYYANSDEFKEVKERDDRDLNKRPREEAELMRTGSKYVRDTWTDRWPAGVEGKGHMV